MKTKLLIAVSVVAMLVAAMAVGIYAYQINFANDLLDSSLGYINIRGGLYTTSSGNYSYMADTESEEGISSQGVTKITARVTQSPEVSEIRANYVAVTAYGNERSSTHTAISSIDDVYISLS